MSVMVFTYLLFIPILLFAIIMFIWRYRTSKTLSNKFYWIFTFFILLPIGLYIRHEELNQELSISDYEIIKNYELTAQETVIGIPGRWKSIRLRQLNSVEDRLYAIKLLESARKDGLTYSELQLIAGRIYEKKNRMN